ncbi:MAG: transposase [Gammaproteobacteria bacterium]
MTKMTNEEWETLHDNFETTLLLDAVKKIDDARTHLGDGENWEPPQIRIDLLKLHQLAMDVVNNGWTENAEDFFEMANDLEMQVSDIIESLESVQNTLNKLLELHPESLAYS